MKREELIKIATESRELEGDFAVMFITADEIADETGPLFEHSERLAQLLTRSPSHRGYWYKYNGLFQKLILDGAKYILKDIEEDRIRSANDRLEDEIGLHYALSLDYEVRPFMSIREMVTKAYNDAAKIVPEHLDVNGASYGVFSFTVDVDDNLLAVLKGINEFEDNHGYFLEGLSVDTARDTINTSWGS